MSRLLKSLAACIVFGVLDPSVFAQAINLDIGRLGGAPSTAYGGAAGQAGHWNRMVVTGGGQLSDLAGVPSAISVSASVVHHFNFLFDNPNTSGDDEQLLDSAHDGAITLDFVGLQNGDYFVYTYAFAPDNRLDYFTVVDCLGSVNPPQIVGGMEWSGTHVQGGTFARHLITVNNSELHIACTVGNLYATVNGVQIVPASPLPATYCTPKVNSLGCTPTISATGTASATSASGFLVESSQKRNETPGLLIYTTSGRAAVPFQGGTLCLNTPIRRTPAQMSGGSPSPTVDCSGTYSIDMNAFAQGALGGSPSPFLTVVGILVDCQYWSRDQGFPPPDNVSLTQGLEYAIGP